MQHAADLGMVAAQAEHAVAGEQVEILGAFDVPQVRPFGADVAAVEADGLQRADVGGVDVLGVELVVAALVLLQQGADVEAGAGRGSFGLEFMIVGGEMVLPRGSA